MGHNKLFAICESKCMVETISKEQYEADIAELEAKHNNNLDEKDAIIDSLLDRIIWKVKGEGYKTDFSNQFVEAPATKELKFLELRLATNLSAFAKGLYLLEKVPSLDTANCTNMNSMFYGCKALKSLPDLNVGKVTDAENMFYGCTKLTTFTENTQNYFKDKIWQFKVDINFGDCPLDRDSILKVFNHLQNVEGKTITISPLTNAYLSNEDKAIATDKGWNVNIKT